MKIKQVEELVGITRKNIRFMRSRGCSRWNGPKTATGSTA